MNRPCTTAVKGLSIVVITTVIMAVATKSTGGEKTAKLNFNNVVNETQKMSDDPNSLSLVWWMPDEYWQACLQDDPMVSQAEIDQIIDALDAYTLVAVVDGKIGVFGGVTFKSEVDIRSNLKLKDSKGKIYRPMSENQVDPDAVNLVRMMKPVIASTIGEMGTNMHFYFFPGKTNDGNDIAKASDEGKFTIALEREEYEWRLPLGSVLPVKQCAKCGDDLSGAYQYCPWDGMALAH